MRAFVGDRPHSARLAAPAGPFDRALAWKLTASKARPSAGPRRCEHRRARTWGGVASGQRRNYFPDEGIYALALRARSPHGPNWPGGGGRATSAHFPALLQPNPDRACLVVSVRFEDGLPPDASLIQSGRDLDRRPRRLVGGLGGSEVGPWQRHFAAAALHRRGPGRRLFRAGVLSESFRVPALYRRRRGRYGRATRGPTKRAQGAFLAFRVCSLPSRACSPRGPAWLAYLAAAVMLRRVP